MRSFEVKNRTWVDNIKSLRLTTAIKPPYLPDGRFGLETYDALVNMQIENGVKSVIVGGTSGEGQFMNWDEHIMLIGHTVNCYGGLIKVVGNTGSNSLEKQFMPPPNRALLLECMLPFTSIPITGNVIRGIGFAPRYCVIYVTHNCLQCAITNLPRYPSTHGSHVGTKS